MDNGARRLSELENCDKNEKCENILVESCDQINFANESDDVLKGEVQKS